MTLHVSPKVEAVARLMRRLSAAELSQLVTLVPALRNVQLPSDDSIIAHFRMLGQEQRGGRNASLDDPFLAGMTYAEYLSLSEEEQDATWEKIFGQADLDMEAIPETDMTPHADLSA